MASTATIEIVVNDGQATQAFQRINAEAAKLGPTLQPVARVSEQTFNNIEGGALKARESAALLGEELGIKIPRALRGTLAESKLVGPALTAAFSVLGPAGIAAVAITTIGSIIEQIQSLRDASRNAILAIQRDALNQETSMLESAQSRNRDLRVRTEVATANELQKLDVHYHAEREALIEEQLKAEMKARITGEHDVVDLANKNLLQLDKAYIAEKKHLLLKASDDVREEMDAEVAVSKKGRDRIVADAKVSMDRINAAEKEGGTLHAVAEAKRALLREETNHKIEEFDREYIEKQRSIAMEGNRAILQAEASASSGREQIEKEYLVRLNEITMREVEEGLALKKKGITQEVVLDQLRTAAAVENNRKLRELAQQRADEEIQIQTETAIAMLPPWQRADAQIVASAEERIRKIREMEAKDKDFRVQGEREVGLIMQKEWRERVESMAGQLESLYDEISTGGIKQFFIKRFKHMVAEMVAAWILGMTQMRNASQQQLGGGGGILGAIFGSLGLGGIFGGGGGPGGTPPFVGGNGDFGGETGGDFGGETGGGSGGSGGLLGSLFGLGASAGGALGAPGTTLPSGAGPAGAGGPIAGLLGKLFSHGAGPVSGAMLGTLGMGLLASNFMGGGILHGLGGAAGGALLGFSIGGPIGALIGAIAGFLSGVFGHSTKKARLKIEADIKAQSQKIEDSYNTFQSDFASSNSALEQLRQQGVDALKQAGVKDIKRSRVGHVDQWVDKAEKEIAATEAERQRREAIVFGAPQFRFGGFVGPGGGGPMPTWFAGTAMHFAGGGAVPAILHEGEYVMRPEAVSQIGRGKLDQMNSGGGRGGDTHIHFNINAIDAKSFKEFLSSGGDLVIVRALRRGSMEGAW